MTNAELIQKIRAEIERLKNENAKLGHTNDIERHEESAYNNACDAFLSFLSTLEKSEKPVPNDLEEAARKYGFEEYIRRCNGGEYSTSEDAFIAGAKWHREQMMKEAVDATVHLEPGAFPVIEIGVGRFGLKVKDKVRVIVLPKEE